MNATELISEIKAKASVLGFSLIGITTPNTPDHFDLFQNWIQAGYQGEMEYLSRPRSLACRADPRELLPQAQSLIVLGMNYPNPRDYPDLANTEEFQEGDEEFPLAGRVAAYAWGRDYHLVMKEKLKQLADYLVELVGKPLQYRVFSDSAPILERDLAQRAGLGWIGKNSCLINPKLGSYFFLGEILLDCALPPDTPFSNDYCGKCNRCIQACPTQCILPNRTVDARRCIAYLTIELRSAIPETFHAAMGNWLFGCDICQEVCPWNQHALKRAVDPELQRNQERFPLDLSQILKLDENEYRQCFSESAIQRVKWGGLARNAAIVLGNLAKQFPQKRERVFGILADALFHHPEAFVRRHVVISLKRIGGQSAKNALRCQLEYEKDAEVRLEIQKALDGWE
ncbi:MAG: tRNA epoxyqueuosine(34) reductase QueG [Candidatus Kryptoniota bacterium]